MTTIEERAKRICANTFVINPTRLYAKHAHGVLIVNRQNRNVVSRNIKT